MLIHMLESHNPTDHFEFTSHPRSSDFVDKEKERKEIDKSDNQELKQQNKINRKRKSINSKAELKSLCLQDNLVIKVEKLKIPTALSLTPLAQG